jgi:hypothetical protein
MKLSKYLTIALSALAVFATLSTANAGDKKSCCEATVDAEKKCEHKCCTEAAKDGKICKKCHPDTKEEKKEDKK